MPGTGHELDIYLAGLAPECSFLISVPGYGWVYRRLSSEWVGERGMLKTKEPEKPHCWAPSLGFLHSSCLMFKAQQDTEFTTGPAWALCEQICAVQGIEGSPGILATNEPEGIRTDQSNCTKHNHPGKLDCGWDDHREDSGSQSVTPCMPIMLLAGRLVHNQSGSHGSDQTLPWQVHSIHLISFLSTAFNWAQLHKFTRYWFLF